MRPEQQENHLNVDMTVIEELVKGQKYLMQVQFLLLPMASEPT